VVVSKAIKINLYEQLNNVGNPIRFKNLIEDLLSMNGVLGAVIEH
jgi:hypothetical protein